VHVVSMLTERLAVIGHDPNDRVRRSGPFEERTECMIDVRDLAVVALLVRGA
jgi:hypothetical protein